MSWKPLASDFWKELKRLQIHDLSDCIFVWIARFYIGFRVFKVFLKECCSPLKWSCYFLLPACFNFPENGIFFHCIEDLRKGMEFILFLFYNLILRVLQLTDSGLPFGPSRYEYSLFSWRDDVFSMYVGWIQMFVYFYSILLKNQLRPQFSSEMKSVIEPHTAKMTIFSADPKSFLGTHINLDPLVFWYRNPFL